MSCRTRVVTAGVLAVAVAGCGGSGHHHPSSTAASAGGGFTAQADAICQRANMRIRRLPTPAATPAGVATYAAQLLPVARTMTGKLAALDPPASAKAEYGRYLSILRSDLGQLRRIHTGHLNPRQLAAAARAIDARGGAQDAKHLKLAACEQSPRPGGR